MWNCPTNEDLAKIPPLYSTDGDPIREKLVYMHFFFGGCDWYIVECSKNEDGNHVMFGYAILNRDFLNAKWGYSQFEELRDLKLNGMEAHRDPYWTPIPVGEVDKIKKGCTWL